MNFVAAQVSGSDGGLWFSNFKNLHISQFNGPGINLIGGTNYKLPHQGLVFENVIIRRQKDYVTALRLENQIRQLTFINSGFEAVPYSDLQGDKIIKGQTIEIQTTDIELAVISFINSTIQCSESGVYI